MTRSYSPLARLIRLAESRRRALAVASLPLLLAGPALGQGLAPEGPEFRVNANTSNGHSAPSVAMPSGGGSVVAWQTYNDRGLRPDVRARWFSAAGVPQGTDVQVNTTTAGDQGLPDVAMDSEGDVVVVWESGNGPSGTGADGQDGDGASVYARRFSAGVPQGPEFRVNTTTAGDQSAPTVAMDADGDFIVAWMSDDGSLGGVYAQRYDAAGVPQGGEFRVNTHTTSRQQNPAVAMDADGDLVVAWESQYQDGSGFGIYVQRYSSSGEPSGPTFRANTFTSLSQAEPAVAANADGDFAVVWKSQAQDLSGYGVYAQRYNAAGVPQGGEIRVNTATAGDQQVPSVAMDSYGDLVVTWQGPGPQGFGVYARAYSGAGAPAGGEVQVDTNTQGLSVQPSVAMNAEGDI
ncbi:MAG TPA: hypothetical protein VF576_10070, partial [Rubricoccaceae bacterium]